MADMLVDSFKNMNVIANNNIRLGQKDVYAVDKLLKYNENTDSYLVLFTDNSKEWIHSSNINSNCITEFKQQQIINNFNKGILNPTGSAFIYVRISSKNYDGISLDVQIQTLMDYCKNNNIIINGIYKDNGISAKDMCKLHSFNNMINDIEYHYNNVMNNNFHNKSNNIHSNTTILFYDVSRFSRNSSQGLEYLDKFHNMKYNIYFLCENLYYNNANSRHNVRNALSQAQFLSESVSDKVNRSLHHKRTILKHHIGGIPFGFKRENGYLVRNNEEYKVIHKVHTIFNRFKNLKSLKSTDQMILNNLKGSHIRGKPFNKSHIYLCLKRYHEIENNKY
jgi:DNA invertase Pin-like site-specific DNA recombinase